MHCSGLTSSGRPGIRVSARLYTRRGALGAVSDRKLTTGNGAGFTMPNTDPSTLRQRNVFASSFGRCLTIRA